MRPDRDVTAVSVRSSLAVEGRGLDGDRSARGARSGHKRQVTLVQAEHLPVIAAFLGRANVDPGLLRRNVVVSGINLVAVRSLFQEQEIRMVIDDTVVLAMTGPCDPCSRMEAALGAGGWNAMRGHGGMTARIEVGGAFGVGDTVAIRVA